MAASPPTNGQEQRTRELTAQLEQRTEALQQSEARFRDVIEGNADAIVVVAHDGVVRFANRAARALFGNRGPDLIGATFGFPLVAGETTELDLVQNAQAIVVEMRVVESAWEGSPACIASLRDITERKHAEESARRLIREQAARTAAEAASRRFRFLAESSTALAASLDYSAILSALPRLCIPQIADWAAVYVVAEDREAERLEVAHRDPAMEGPARELSERELRRVGPGSVTEVLATRDPVLHRRLDDVEFAGMAADVRHQELPRELRVASLMLVPLVVRDRCIGAMVLVSTDPERSYDDEDLVLAQNLALRAALAIDNARLYREAQLANKAKLDFLAVVSHDLRTPLNSILGHAQLLSMGIPDPLTDASRERVERIQVGATHLIYLIDQLLAFARLDAGHEEVRIEEVALRAVVLDVAAVMEPLATTRGLRLEIEAPPEDVHLSTDPDKLRQVLFNLVGNAVKYTERGFVRLAVRLVEEGAVAIDVADTGPGIACADQEHIFEPYWQVQSRRSGEGGGAGLGLSVVQRLVSMLNSRITLDSVPGRGSVFTVTMPSGVATSGAGGAGTSASTELCGIEDA